jgi:hypothetical protein
MANECEYNAKVIGSPNILQTISERLKEADGLYYGNWEKIFDKLELEYEWGSKWMNYELEYGEGEDHLYMFGSSAWAPAEGFWEKLSSDYDLEVYLEYSEPGNGFAGYLEWKSGLITRNEEMTWWEYIYLKDNEYFWEELNYNISDLYTLDEVWDLLEQVNLTDEDKSKIEEIYKEKFI